MQRMDHKQNRERIQIPVRQPLVGNVADRHRARRNNQVAASSPRPRSNCTCSNRPGSVKCSRHGYLVPSDRMRTPHANKEIVKRALTPPVRRMTLRWWNFRPTPSRLCNMSMA